MSGKVIESSRRGSVATLTLTGRTPGNRIDESVAQALCAVAEELVAAEDVAVVVLRARGAQFCSGAGRGAVPDWAAALAALPQPLIAAIQGDAVDEGAELALLADLRVMATGTRLRFNHLAQGRLPNHGATQRLPRAVGRTRALEMLLSGRWLSAREAQRLGLVVEVVAPRQFARRTARLADELAEKGPLALRYAKEAVRAGGDLTLAQGIRLEQDLYVLLQTTADRSEGVRAFLAGRRPVYRGG